MLETLVIFLVLGQAAAVASGGGPFASGVRYCEVLVEVAECLLGAIAVGFLVPGVPLVAWSDLDKVCIERR